MKFFEEDWSTERKVSFIVEFAKVVSERIDLIFSNIMDSITLDGLVKEAKSRMSQTPTAAVQEPVIEEVAQ